MPKVKSKSQWRKFGAMLYRGEMTKGKFDKRVKGVKYKGLPNKKGGRK